MLSAESGRASLGLDGAKPRHHTFPKDKQELGGDGRNASAPTRAWLVSRWGCGLVSGGQRYSDAAFIVYARGGAPIDFIGCDHAVAAAG